MFKNKSPICGSKATNINRNLVCWGVYLKPAVMDLALLKLLQTHMKRFWQLQMPELKWHQPDLKNIQHAMFMKLNP